MLEYKKRYNTLNKAQKQAVDHIEGPLMVLAGPGTGKTELLSVRAANILQKTDTNPNNILCLTFTESGVRAMQERLIGLIGQDAYKVNIQTFHGFGSEIINNNSDYFYSGADFSPADELSTYEILYKLFSGLPHDNPLSSKLDGKYTYMKKVQSTITDFKRAGLTPDEIQQLAKHAGAFIEYATPLVQKIWPSRIDKSFIAKVPELVSKISDYSEDPLPLAGYSSLFEIFLSELKLATEEATQTNKTNTLTAWKEAWLEKNPEGLFVLKDEKRLERIVAASSIYQDYLTQMQNSRLYDYDDMILRVVHALEIFHDLRFNLQEKYLYIMVDEFQDTNGAQMRILHNLIQTPTGDEPNIMVVGDDDQAIYSFQGAQVSNILDFRKSFKKLPIIALEENYRSTQPILDISRDVISQGDNRLELQLKDISKKLHPQAKGGASTVALTEFDNQPEEMLSIAKNIKQELKSGIKPNEIAVLARNKRDIQDLLPYLHHEKIKISYEHDENILDSEPLLLLYNMARVVQHIEEGGVQNLDQQLSEILSHPAFGISPKQLWETSLEAYNKRLSWIEIMLESKHANWRHIAEWFIDLAALSQYSPLEIMIDFLVGAQHRKEFTSPFKNYFFSNESLKADAQTYVLWLESLATIRTKLRDYKPEKVLLLKDFTQYIDLAREANITLKNHYSAEVSLDAVQVMTAHKAKGLEFESVHVLNVSDDIWGIKSRGQSSTLSYPSNMPIGITGDTYDDKLRLFFVAATRAKKFLNIYSSKQNLVGKSRFVADFLVSQKWTSPQPPKVKDDLQLEAASNLWNIEVDLKHDHTLKDVLSSVLKKYKLSATHLNNFLDVTQGGPQYFLTNNLLHFPQALSPSAAMGSAVHKALQKAHQHLRINGDRRPIEDVVGDFESYLKQSRLDGTDFDFQLKKGSQALQVFLEQNYNSFTPYQEVEYDFSRQEATLEDVKLTGIIDVLEVDSKQKTIDISDYKTGKPALSWSGKTDFEKLKLHKYKQQLMFYKLLIESSKEFSNYKVDSLRLTFVEQDGVGISPHLDAVFTNVEYEAFKKLVTKVWQKILEADFVDTSKYDPSYKGVLEFEADLLS